MKKLLHAIFTIALLFGVYIVGSLIYGSYIMTDSYRDYVYFCSKYIKKIDKYYTEHGVYPKELSIFKKPNNFDRYDKKECKYFLNGNKYMLFTTDGFRDKCYNITTKTWEKC